ncbi:D-fructose-6-phosphate amidotransferase [Pontibacter sp. HJ8]
MPAYIIVEIEVTDPATYEEYKKLTPGSLVPFAGRFIVRGGAAELLEGDQQPNRIVVLEFPTLEQAKAWWSSEEYAPAKALRQSASTTRMIAVEGFQA